MKKKYVPLAVFALIAALFAAALYHGRVTPPTALAGKPMPVFKMEGLADKDIRGASALVNFFASWCIPCAEEQPQLAAARKETGIAIFGVAYKDKLQNLRPWYKKHGNPFKKTGLDPRGRAAIDWGVYGVPETFVIDKAGIIRYRHVGPLTAESYNKTIRPLIAELQK